MSVDQLATYTIVLREGIEALLLLMLFNRAATHAEHRKWVVTGSLLGMAVPMAFVTFFFSVAERTSPYIDAATNLVAGIVLLYVFIWSRSIMSHVKEHVEQMSAFDGKLSAGFMVMSTSWFIVAREMTEICLMLANTYHGDPTGTILSIAAGLLTLVLLAHFFDRISRAVELSTFFRYSSWIFGAMGIYYIWEACEKAIDIDWTLLL